MTEPAGPDGWPVVTTPDPIIGFDGAAGDTSVVVMHRGPDGTWRVDTVDRLDQAEITRTAAGIFERVFRRSAHVRVRPHDQVVRAAQPWPELVEAWIAEHAGDPPLELTDEQRDLLAGFYAQHVREGKLSWSTPMIRI